MSTLLGTLGTRLNRAVTAYNETIGSYEARVMPSARRFADHGAVSEGSELPELEPITVSARTVQNPALQLDLGPDLATNAPRPRRLRAAD
jgi:DNA recombination protein RmuC